jgi:putative transposase
VLKAHPVPA